MRKELELNDETYENEVRVLSALQRLKHPNILQLVGCYTLNSKNSLISPFVPGGTLRKFLEIDVPPYFPREEMICSMAGLASAVWALHEFGLDDTELSYKGHHQDLRQDNILVDGTRFILADFGLSSIKPMDEKSKTPFKGRRGYCQAPECAELGRPFREYEATRATDIFALACILADLVVHFVRGPKGIQDFKTAREFTMSPICYYLYHKGKSSNDAVTAWLQKTTHEDGSKSMQSISYLLSTMLEIAPNKRPSAAEVTANLYISTITAFSECLMSLYALFESNTDALVEKARFLSWVLSQDTELYCRSLGATSTSKMFDSIVDILRQLKAELKSINMSHAGIDSRSFLEVRTLNTQLLNLLSPERGSNARSRLQSLLLATLTSEKLEAKFSATRSSTSNSPIAQKAETKSLVARIEDITVPTSQPFFRIISEPIVDIQEAGLFTVGRLRYAHQKKPVIFESVRYQDPIRREKLLPRIYALCDLVSSGTIGQDLRLPPFYGLHEDENNLCFDIVYGFPRSTLENPNHTSLISLHDLLVDRDESTFPPWESRCRLAKELAESLASFHDVDWYHKDLTPFNILFFPTRNTPPYARAASPYILGFHHSRSAIDDFTEGPLQDQRHQRYHHPKYISVHDHQYARFCPEFDHYSLGILLIEIGFWATIDTVMEGHNKLSNHDFSTTLIQQKLPLLSFRMGTWYVEIVRECLTAPVQQYPGKDNGSEFAPSPNLLFIQKVVMPLKAYVKSHRALEPSRKREREADDNSTPSISSKRRVK